MDAQLMLRNIIRTQNETILKDISEKYKLDYDMLVSKYLTPSFYDIGISETNIYDVKYEESSSKTSKRYKDK